MPDTPQNSLTQAERAALDAFSADARREYNKLSDEIRKEFRSNLNGLLRGEIRDFVREARKALGEVSDSRQSREDLGSSGDGLGDLAGDLFGLVLGDRVSTRRAAGNAAKALLSEFFPDLLGGSGNRRPSRSQAAGDLLRLLNLARRNL